MVLPKQPAVMAPKANTMEQTWKKTLALGERKEPLLVLKCKQQLTEDS